jgi:hypothetical protein
MNSVNYVTTLLHNIIQQFPTTKISYEYDSWDDDHYIKVEPQSVYASIQFSKYETKIIYDFIESYPSESICFITENSLVDLDGINKIKVVSGKLYKSTNKFAYNATRKPYVDNLWKWKCGLSEQNLSMPGRSQTNIDIAKLADTEWNAEFEQLMRKRLMMGAIRYGKLRDINKPQFARVESAIKRLRAYLSTLNKEYLVDAANLCMVEFVENDNAHFESIDDGEHVKIK